MEVVQEGSSQSKQRTSEKEAANKSHQHYKKLQKLKTKCYTGHCHAHIFSGKAFLPKLLLYKPHCVREWPWFFCPVPSLRFLIQFRHSKCWSRASGKDSLVDGQS